MSSDAFQTTTVPSNFPHKHLAFLDGIRGLAALYVLLYHIVLYHNIQRLSLYHSGNSLPPALQFVSALTEQGHYAVDIFIVLSGYCLMLPVVQSETGQLTGGFRGYIMRRARRILPPYYAALFITLTVPFLLTAVSSLKFGPSLYTPSDLPSIHMRDILTHLLLVHNLFVTTCISIDPPMWSVAAEWQIYFLFPLLLLPVWRRFGGLAAAFVAFAVTVPMHYILPHFLRQGRNFDWTCPWYLGLFALGMVGAICSFSQKSAARKMFLTFPWGLASVGLLGLSALIENGWPNVLSVTHFAWTGYRGDEWCSDMLFGGAGMCFLIYCTRLAQTQGMEAASHSFLLRLLNNKPVLALGAFSYSLYLVHFPLLMRILPAIVHTYRSPTQSFCVALILCVSVCLIAAYLFHLMFERPFMSSRSRRSVFPNTMPNSVNPTAETPQGAL